MSTFTQPPSEDDSPAARLDWARNFVAHLNGQQRVLLEKWYADAKDAQDKRLAEQKQKEQQQAILESLTQQVPVTVDVVRSSTSPESMMSGEGGDVTVKDVLIGKMKGSYRPTGASSYESKPYRPRGSRERVFYEDHMYTFDKMSYDCKKKFYRCERRNTCSARIHTPFDSDKVIHRVQNHNHLPPSQLDLANYDFNLANIRQGCVLHLNLLTSHQRSHLSSSSLLTPKSETDEETAQSKSEKSTSSSESSQHPNAIRFPLPDNFDRLSEAEALEIDMVITKYLMKHTDLRNELLETKGNFPIFFPNAEKSELVLFVANVGEDETIFEMIQVKERNEKSIREAIQSHFKQESNRSLMINVSGKINVPLSQQMIDQWKTEEFIRIDISKQNFWKIHHLTKID